MKLNEFRTIDQIHKIVKKKKNKPKYCEICNEYKERLDLASINHGYTEFPKDYMYLCQSCHGLYDKLKELRIFNRKQKEYTWKIIHKLDFDIIRYHTSKSFILRDSINNYVELIPTQLVEHSVSKKLYYFFKINGKELIRKIQKVEKKKRVRLLDKLIQIC